LIRMWIYISFLFWESNFDPSDLLTLAENYRRDLYRTTHNIHKRQTSTSPQGFQLATSAGAAGDPRLRSCSQLDRRHMI